MKYLRNRFIAGLLILLPLVVTGWIIYKIFVTVDSFIEPLQVRFPILDWPGVGFGIVLTIILLAGIFAGNLIGRRVIGLGERGLFRLPIVRRIYTAVKELSEVFLADRKTVFRKVVLIQYPHPGTHALAFVTEEAPGPINGLLGRPMLHVFVPTTPNPTSGFLLFVPADEVVELPLDVEEGMKMVISGGAFVPTTLKRLSSETRAGA